MLKGTHLLSYPFLGLLLIRDAQGCALHFRTPDPRSEESWLKITGGLISNHWQLNPPRETNAEPLFASKIFGLDVSNDSPYTFTTHDR